MKRLLHMLMMATSLSMGVATAQQKPALAPLAQEEKATPKHLSSALKDITSGQRGKTQNVGVREHPQLSKRPLSDARLKIQPSNANLGLCDGS